MSNGAFKRQSLTYSQMWEVFKKCPAVVIDAVILQDKQLAYIAGSDVTGNLYSSARVIFIINFDYLQQKHWINNHFNLSAGWDNLYLQRVQAECCFWLAMNSIKSEAKNQTN